MKASDYSLEKLQAVTAIVQLATQPPNVFQQVTIRRDKTLDCGLIRLGETPGDEALCWIRRDHIEIIHVLGQAIPSTDGKWTVQPIMEEAA